jgi:hypothetical protein
MRPGRNTGAWHVVSRAEIRVALTHSKSTGKSLTHATKPEFMQLARRDWANVFARLAVVLAQTGRNAA